MLVFNRWGEKVFESNHIDQGWDGSYKGEKAPVGIYTYDIRYEILNGKKYIKTGEVELVY
jgi:gliding motility-associated-like protein